MEESEFEYQNYNVGQLRLCMLFHRGCSVHGRFRELSLQLFLELFLQQLLLVIVGLHLFVVALLVLRVLEVVFLLAQKTMMTTFKYMYTVSQYTVDGSISTLDSSLILEQIWGIPPFYS